MMSSWEENIHWYVSKAKWRKGNAKDVDKSLLMLPFSLTHLKKVILPTSAPNAIKIYIIIALKLYPISINDFYRQFESFKLNQDKCYVITR